VKLATGSRLGPYEILAPLGAGGMGEVYRARDGRLGRDVAVKVLPDRLASDADAVARFEREARAVAALSHPNILAIHDVGSADGIAYAVTELLEGTTLRERMEGGAALPFRKCVEYGIQIVEGLAAAHERGIVHRDLKPENIFVTPEGRIKILDFGLAKAAPAPDEAATNSPTVAPETDPGTVLGTVGYMAPEQVRGRAADHRSDIFSFGAVLYEMATGRRAFKGDSAVETMNAVLKEEPPEISTVRGVPAEFERVVRHCLEKSPAERFQSARDIAFDLRTTTADSSTRTKGAGRSIPVRRWMPAVVVLAAAALAFMAYLGGRRLGAREAFAHPPSFQALTFRRGMVMSARFLSDGKTVAYSAALQDEPMSVFTVRSTAPESQRLTLPPATLFSVSRSDELLIGLGFHYTVGFNNESTLARVSISGGTPRVIAERVVSADWAPDAENLAVARISGRQCVLEYPMGKVLFATSGWIDSVRVSPDGQWVAFAEHPLPGDTIGNVVIVDRAGHLRRLASGLKAVRGSAWSADGRQLYWSGARMGNTSILYASTLSGATRAVFDSGAADMVMDVQGGMTLLGRYDQRRETEMITAASPVARDLSWLDWSFPADLSRDGELLLTVEQGRATKSQYLTYLRKTDGSPASQLGPGTGLSMSPDHRFFTTLRGDDYRKLAVVPIGAGTAQEIAMPGVDPVAATWFPDGRRLLIAGNSATSGAVFYEKTLDGGAPRQIASPPMRPFCYAISPDGSSFAGLTTEGRVAVVPVGGGAPRTFPADVDAQCVLTWDTAGRSLYYIDSSPIPAQIQKLDTASGVHLPFRQVAPADRAGVQTVSPVFMTPDGQTIAYSYRRMLGELLLVRGLK
jgi:serine/threonine protein kinase/Tol biopolymer transport system component